MDSGFRELLLCLVELEIESCDLIAKIILQIHIVDYGERKGFLSDIKHDDLIIESEESDESVAFRALCSDILLRDFLGKDLEYMVDMTREQHLDIIRRAEVPSRKIEKTIELLQVLPEKKSTIH